MNPSPRPLPDPTSEPLLPFPEPSPPPPREAMPAPAPDETSGPYWDHCPNCGARLHNIGCKYRCTRCAYFMSCSDFD
jgi:hypothetical protein